MSKLVLGSLVRILRRELIAEVDRSFIKQVLAAFIRCGSKNIYSRIPISAVVEEFNRGRAESEKVSPRRIGTSLTRLGFDACRMRTGRYCRYWDEKKVQTLARQFGIPYDGLEEGEGKGQTLRMPAKPTSSLDSTRPLSALAGPLRQVREICAVSNKVGEKQIEQALQLSARLLALALPEAALQIIKDMKSGNPRARVRAAEQIRKAAGLKPLEDDSGPVVICDS